MKTNLWCQINDFLFIWKGNREQINNFGAGGKRGWGGEKNFISTFVYSFGVYQHKIFSVYKHLIFVVYKHQYYCV